MRAVGDQQARAVDVVRDAVDAFRGARGRQLEQDRPRARRRTERNDPVQPLFGDSETAAGQQRDPLRCVRVEDRVQGAIAGRQVSKRSVDRVAHPQRPVREGEQVVGRAQAAREDGQRRERSRRRARGKAG